MIWIVLNIILLLVLAISFQPEDGPTRFYWIGLGVKTIASLSFGWVYMIYLGAGDTSTFHVESFKLYELSERSFAAYVRELFTPHHPIFQAEWRTEFFTKILSIPYIATRGNYWLSALYLMLFCYWCVWFLVRSIHRHYPTLFFPAFIAFTLFPSPVFWSSGILKDTLINGSLFFLAGICVRYRFQSRFTFSQITVAVACMFMLFYLKFYLAAVVGLLMGLLAFDKVVTVFFESRITRLALMMVFFIGATLLVSRVNRNLNFNQLPSALTANYQTIKEKSAPNAPLDLFIKPTYSSLISNAPLALIAGLFRPFIWEGDLPKAWFGVENLLLLMLFLINLSLLMSVRPDRLGLLCMLFVLILATLLPMAAPNFGSLMRYKAAYLPFFLFLMLINPYRRFILKAQ